MEFFEQNDILKQLAHKMGLDVDNFHPLDNVEHDYQVLEWMRDIAKVKHPETHATFISYISGPMHAYVKGDYVKAAICAIGVIDTGKK